MLNQRSVFLMAIGLILLIMAILCHRSTIIPEYVSNWILTCGIFVLFVGTLCCACAV